MKKFLLFFFAALIIFAYFYTRPTAVTEQLDTYIYDLPYAPGTSHKVVQGYGGWFSHKEVAAIDFDMPEGTAVYAAREGTVYAHKDDGDKGGPFPAYKKYANYIMIRHSDGSTACYWHLKKDGVLTKTGFVQKGQLIGYSGATGFLWRRHLHFSVKKYLKYEKDAYVRTRFLTEEGVMELKDGQIHKNK